MEAAEMYFNKTKKFLTERFQDETGWTPYMHAVISPLLEMCKSRPATGQGYFRWNSTVTGVTRLEPQHVRSERNLRDLLVQSAIL